MTLTVLLAGAALLAPKSFDFYPYGPYDSAVPKPESILGYRPGEKHTTFREQEQVVQAIVRAAPKRAKLFEFGKSWEGRPLRLVAIGSEANIARLDDIRRRMARLASGEPGAADEIARLPAIVWVNETIHGNESASFESGMWLLYNLAASRHRAVTSALDDVLVLVNPVYNPDGHERFAVWNRSVAVASDHPSAYEGSEPDWVHGRTNHYRFDMNRDRISFSQAETRAEVKEYARWNPQVYIDQHGQTSEYFFPPNAMATNVNVDRERLEKWTEVFGKRYAAEFDRKGWLYFVRWTFDFYAVCYLDTYATLMGAIGMTHETDGGRRLADVKEDGTPLTVEGGMAKHFTTAMATVFAASEHRRPLLEMFHAYKRRGASGEHAGSFRRVVATSEDLRPLRRLADNLERANVKSYFAAAPFTQPDAHDYWSESVGPRTFGSEGYTLVIDMAQPNGQLAKALLEPGQNFEKAFVENQIRIGEKLDRKERYPESEFPEFYDITGWSLVYGHGVQAWWCESAPPVKASEGFEAGTARVPELQASDVGYLLRYRDETDICAAAKLAGSGVRVRVVEKEMPLAGRTVRRGSFLFLKGRNEDNLREKLQKSADEHDSLWFETISSGFPISGVNSPGGDGNRPVRAPKIGVVFGDDASTTDFGAVWYLLEREFGLDFVPLHKSGLDRNLSDFTCLLFPAGGHTASEKLKQWIQGGGCAVVLGSPGWALGDGRLAKLDPAVDERAPAKSVPGAYFLAQLDHRSFLSLGYRGEGKSPIAMQVDGNRFFKGGSGGLAAVAFGDAEKKLLSGWAWPEDTEKNLRGAYAVYEQPMGAGRVVVFMNNPCERAMFPGLHKMLLNAILLGPR